jgi:hypothetical protein
MSIKVLCGNCGEEISWDALNKCWVHIVGWEQVCRHLIAEPKYTQEQEDFLKLGVELLNKSPNSSDRKEVG